MGGRRFVIVALAGVLAVLLVALGLYWFVIRSDPPPEASVVCGVDVDDPEAVTSVPAGDWRLATGDEVFVGYRVQEQFGGDTLEQTAVGRTPAVEGDLTIDGAEVTAARVTADVTQLESEESRRDRFIATNGLETETFPEAAFDLTEPIDLPTTDLGTEVTVDAVGELTLHGVTREVTIPIEACYDGEAVDIAGSLPVVFEDYDIAPPNVAGFVTVDAEGTLELQLRFVPASSSEGP